MPHWLVHFLGLDSATGTAYLFWSGFGGVLFSLPFFGLLAHHVLLHNCHAPRCPRIGRYRADGKPYCRRHHPKEA